MPRRAKPILLVDDHDLTRSVVSRMLAHLGYENVDQATCGEGAEMRLRERVYDLLITDLNMKPISGIDLLLSIKGRVQPVPRVLVMSATSATEQMIQARAAGADDYLVKPFKPAALERKVCLLLQ